MFSGDPDENHCEKQLLNKGRVYTHKARGAGRAAP